MAVQDVVHAASVSALSLVVTQNPHDFAVGNQRRDLEPGGELVVLEGRFSRPAEDGGVLGPVDVLAVVAAHRTG